MSIGLPLCLIISVLCCKIEFTWLLVELTKSIPPKWEILILLLSYNLWFNYFFIKYYTYNTTIVSLELLVQIIGQLMKCENLNCLQTFVSFSEWIAALSCWKILKKLKIFLLWLIKWHPNMWIYLLWITSACPNLCIVSKEIPISL